MKNQLEIKPNNTWHTSRKTQKHSYTQIRRSTKPGSKTSESGYWLNASCIPNLVSTGVKISQYETRSLEIKPNVYSPWQVSRRNVLLSFFIALLEFYCGFKNLSIREFVKGILRVLEAICLCGGDCSVAFIWEVFIRICFFLTGLLV